MSKAFTKEDDDGGVALAAPLSFVVPSGPFHLTALGAAKLKKASDARVCDVLDRAEILAPTVASPERATLGVTVHVESEGGEKKSYRLVTSEERGLLGEGCSIHSPFGTALLGKEVGDTCEVKAPRGNEELTVTRLEGEADVLGASALRH